ncbi:lamin tail domain-containing protein [Spirilliplanes yamanashiensis]|uniref:LTD domain-containing protein n=1 Tax=Spirilliplanes yamanashiensis TaxID=42233 RepID=A0A8J3Y440_9ACTN|nr:lamin tail domain-containing protein [Spirilliplanes yamanashiensis]MDP9820150.1 hypothetical protein [Spirilliplanes yamanashiensis]GIJ01030.1 hypothetical protein Sya03_03820 [Spirilliplanes yamanashiensis]
MQLRPAVPAYQPAAPAPSHALEPLPPTGAMSLRPPTLVAALAAVALGASAAVFAFADPAAAAPPTITVTPSPAIGWSVVTISGTADPRTLVQLNEGAYYFGRSEMAPSRHWAGDPNPDVAEPTSAMSDDNGRYSIRRVVDSGFFFSVTANEETSPIVEMPMQAVPVVNTLTSTAANTVDIDMFASPGQPHLPVQILRRSGTGWLTVNSGYTDEEVVGGTVRNGDYDRSITGEPSGTQTYRVYVGADPLNLLLGGYSHQMTLTVAGTGSGTNVGTPHTENPTPGTTTPAPGTTTPAPGTTTPAPGTTTPAPGTTTPAPGTTTPPPGEPGVPPVRDPDTPPTPPVVKPVPPKQPGLGSVQFSRINYDAPGKDRKTKKSLNGEWVRLTNRTGTTINLKNWTIRDVGGHVYTFRGNAYLVAGRSVTVHTGPGTNGRPSLHRYWGAWNHVWNNGGDTATLRNSAGKTIDTCRWTSNRRYTEC